jgi:hypothetical protein
LKRLKRGQRMTYRAQIGASATPQSDRG